MLAGQSGRLAGWLALAALVALAVAAVGWCSAEAIAQVENAPLSGQSDDTVPDPIGDLDQPIGATPATDDGASTTMTSGTATSQSDDSRMFFAILVVAAIFILPLVLASYLSKLLRMPDHFGRMAVVLFAILGGTAATYFEWPPKLGIDLSGGAILIYEVEQKDFKEMDKLVAAISKRVNPGGIKETTVRPYGDREIEIIIPEADDAEMRRTQDIISRQGQLEFRIVADDHYDKPIMERARDPMFKDAGSAVYFDPNDIEAKWVPVAAEEGSRLAGDRHYATRTNKRGQLEVLLLVDTLNVTGDYLTTATPDRDQVGKPCVSFGFNPQGARLFGKLTRANLPDPAHADLQRLLAIVLDQRLESAPSIRSQITDRGQITGSFTERQVEDLSAVLTAGSLPTKLREEPTTMLKTGATLGADTIRKGQISMLVSTVAVIVFMLIYYRFAGLVANLALLLNVLLIVAFMILFHAAFTLSGLAGLALTVGMAVDANVLIYERMREELARGATMRMAIRNGFERATTTIVDANVTTLISAIVLFWIGTDQVKGFAVTLILGIVMNLFTAITFTRLLFDVAEKQRWITQLKMLRMMENPNFDFIGKRFLAVGLSLALIGAGLVGVVARGRGLLDIDFTGGVSVEALFEQPQEIADIRQRVDELPDVTVQDIRIEGETPGKRFLIITSKSDIDETQPPTTGPKTNIQWVEEQLKSAFSDEQHRLDFNRLTWDEIKTVAQATPNAGEQEKPNGPAKPAAKAEKEPAADETAPAEKKTPPAADAESKSKPAADEKPTDENKQSRFSPADEHLLALADEEAPEPSKQDDSDATPAKTQSDAGVPEAKQPASDSADAKEAAQEQRPEKRAAADPFAGGSETTLKFSQTVDHETLTRRIKDALKASGHDAEEATFEIDNKEYETGSERGFKEWTLKTVLPAGLTKDVLENAHGQLAREPYFPSSNKVGASVAGNTQLQATYALLASLALIVVYVWIRFQQVSFGFASVLALVHDVLVALGALALSFWLAELPFMEFLLLEPFKVNLPIIAAFLTIIGYSINDTIVIFDRIRELRGKSPDLSPDLVNLCINQTLSRTLLTSLTVFIVVLILYVFGGQAIHGFAFTLVVGTISGTYSTVYIATPVLIWMNRRSASATPAKSAVAAAGR